MSSSSPSQWMPSRLRKNADLSTSDAWSRRGNHAIGAPIVRPSSSSTHRQWSSKRTDRGSGEIVIPCPFEFFAPLFDKTNQLRKHAGREAAIIGQADLRAKPE